MGQTHSVLTCRVDRNMLKISSRELNETKYFSGYFSFLVNCSFAVPRQLAHIISRLFDNKICGIE